MDYIYSQLDPSAFDLSKCLIFHNFKDLPEPQEKLYKRVAFVTDVDEFDLLNDKMYICLLIEGRYTWVDALNAGNEQAAIDALREIVNTKADDSEVRESFGEVIQIIENTKSQLMGEINTKADSDIVNQNFEAITGIINEKEAEIRELISVLIVNIEHTVGGLKMDKTWQEIWNAFMDGKTVLCKYWPEWLEDALYYPPRALYPMVGIGMQSPNEYVCYTGDGTFAANSPEDYPCVDSYSEDDGELVPVQLTCSREDTELYVDEALTITAFADFGGEYSIDWEVTPVEGELTDFHYIKEGKSLTITPKISILEGEIRPKIKIVAKMHGIPSICVPLFITAIPERLV